MEVGKTMTIKCPPSTTVLTVLACLGCLVQVQWTLYAHQLQIDLLAKNNLKENEPITSEILGESLGHRSKRSVNSQQHSDDPDTNHTTKLSETNTKLIREEVSKHLNHLLKTQICPHIKKVCPKGARGRRGKTGAPGKRGRRGPPGPSCEKCSITIDKVKALIRSSSGSRGSPSGNIHGIKGEKGEPGETAADPIISDSPKTSIVNQSDIVSLYCGAKGYPVPKVTWQKVNSSLPVGRHVSYPNGTLIIMNAKKSDQAIYKCMAKNIFPGEASAFVTVIVQENTSIVQNPSPVIQEEGETCTFACAASGTPTPTITWSKAFSTLPVGRHNVSEQVVKNKDGLFWKSNILSSNLTLTNLSLDDGGLFICKASNKLKSETVMAQLSVVKPVFFNVQPPLKLTMNEGKKLVINCQAANAVSQRWFKPTQGQNSVTLANGSLVIYSLNSRDHGLYRCIARNNFKEITATMDLKVLLDKNWGLDASAILTGPYGNARYIPALLNFLRPVSPNTYWKRCWHSTTDGWDFDKTLWPSCELKGRTVLILRSNHYVFGGYNGKSYAVPRSKHKDVSKRAPSFIYSLYNTRRFNPIKLTLKPTYWYNQYAPPVKTKGYGPIFGGGYDLIVQNKRGSTQPYTFHPPPGCKPVGEDCPYFAGNGEFNIDDAEMFYKSTKP